MTRAAAFYFGAIACFDERPSRRHIAKA